MVTIRNRRNRPVIVNLDNKSSVHFGPGEVKDIADDDFKSTEFKEKIDAQDLVVLVLK